MAQPAFGNISAQASGSTSAIATLPTGLTVGDLLIAVCNSTNTTSRFTSTGWTSYTYQQYSNAGTIEVLYRIVTGTEAASYTFSATGSPSGVSVRIFQITNANSSPFIANALGGTASGAALTASGLTSTYSNSLLLLVANSPGPNSMGSVSVVNSNPTWTGRYTDLYGSAGSQQQGDLWSASYSPTGGTGNYTINQTLNTALQGILIAVRPSTTPSLFGSLFTFLAPSAHISTVLALFGSTFTFPTVTSSLIPGKWSNAAKSPSATPTNVAKTPPVTPTNVAKNASTITNLPKT